MLVPDVARSASAANAGPGSQGRRSARRPQQREDPRVTVDLQLIDDLDLLEANDPPESSQTLRREAPVHELIAGVHLAGLVNLDRRSVSC
jgi:hypothetical protein